MSSFSSNRMDKDLEYSKIHERKMILAAALNITLQRKELDRNRYEEKGANGGIELSLFCEGEGSSKVRKHGYFEVIRLSLRRFSAQNTMEESIVMGFENSELFTSFRDRDFWLEYMANDLSAVRQKFPPTDRNTGDPLRDWVLHEFGRLAEKSTRPPTQDSIFYLSLNMPLEGIEELMYQIILGDLAKKITISPEMIQSAMAAHAAQQAPPQQAYQAPPQQAYQAPPQQAYQEPPQQAYQEPPQQAYQEPPQQAYQEPAAPEPVQDMAPAAESAVSPGMTLLLSKRYDEAAEYYKSMAKKSPKEPEGWFGLSACLFLTGEIKKCTLYYNRCIDIAPKFDISSHLIKLSGGDTRNLVMLTEQLISLENNKEAQKYIDYLQDKLPPAELESLISQKQHSQDMSNI